jgi:HAE1 family hydrophobic/amphiphilic exporter-1
MGMQLPKHREAGREIPVRVRFREEDRESLSDLSAFLVPSAVGEQMALSSVTNPEFLPTPETIIRRNKRVGRTITLELEDGRERDTRERLAAVLSLIDLPEGVTFGAEAGVQVRTEDMAGMWWALVLSIIFVSLMMGFLFESFILPLSIIFTIPLSIIGVWWSHFLLGKDLDFLGMVAIVLLVGVVVNNGIVLIDYVKQLRDRGEPRAQALLAATQRRFNPIMMTALTTIVGLIPLYFAGANSIGLSYSSFATTLIGGMTTATLLTLLVIPVLYTMFDDLRTAFAAAVERAVARLGGAERTVVETAPEG